VILLDPNTGENVGHYSLYNEETTLQSMAVSPDGELLALGCGDGTIEVWDIARQSALYFYIGDDGPAQYVEFSPDGERLASVSSGPGSDVKIWDMLTGDCVRVTLDANRCGRPVFAPGGRYLAYATGGERVKIWNLDANLGLQTLGDDMPGGPVSVAWSADGRYIASGWIDGTIKVWERAAFSDEDDGTTETVMNEILVDE
jgi:WD40 repeat protein